MNERKYFHINESSARTAHDMMSMRDYTEGSTTAEYRSLRRKSRRRQSEPTDLRNATQRRWRTISTGKAALE